MVGVLRRAADAAQRVDVTLRLQDPADIKRRIGVAIDVPIPCDGAAFKRLGDELDVDVVLRHEGGTRFYGTGTRPQHVIIFVEGDGSLLHATGAVIVRDLCA